MKYLIIGLGIYGSNLAIDLTNMGHEVIGADINASIVEGIKNEISTAYIIDAVDDKALEMLPITNVDLVIVAIGENFGASIRTVAVLKNAGVKHIYARAGDPLHESILEGFQIDRIIKPEQFAARNLVWEMMLGTEVESLQIDADTYVLRFGVPDYFTGFKYSELDFEGNYKLRIIAYSRKRRTDNKLGFRADRATPFVPDADAKVEVGDILTVVGSLSAYRALCRAIS